MPMPLPSLCEGIDGGSFAASVSVTEARKRVSGRSKGLYFGMSEKTVGLMTQSAAAVGVFFTTHYSGLP